MNDKNSNADFEEDDDMLEIVELEDAEGNSHKFVHLGTMEYKGEWYAFFQPSEEETEIDTDQIAILRIEGEEDNEKLVSVEDEKLLDEIFEEFCKQLDESEEGEGELYECDCDECEGEDKDGGCGCGCEHKH